MKNFIFLFAVFCFAGTVHISRAADTAGSADHPLVKRVKGSEIFFSSKADFGQLKLALGKLEWDGGEAKVKPYESATVEGKLLTNY